MSTYLSDRRSALAIACLLFSAVLLASLSNVSAQGITYNIVDYPANETDLYTGGNDTIFGTITTDGSLGALTSQNIVSESISLYNSVNGTTYFAQPTNTSFSFAGQLSATPSQILLSTGGECQFSSSPAGIEAFRPRLSIIYDNGHDDQFQFSGEATSGLLVVPPPRPLAGFLAADPSGAPGSIGSGGPDWIIATIAPSFWASAVSGNWSDSTKWTNGVPNSDGVVAVIAASTTAALTVTLDEPVTLGTLLLASGNRGVGYSLSGSNTLTLSNTSDNNAAMISVTDGTHVVDAPVVLASNLVVTSTSTNPWTLSFGTAGSITDNGNKLSLTMNAGNGALILSSSDDYGGGTIVTAGRLDVTNSDALPDGSSLAVSAGGTFLFDPSSAAAQINPVPEPTSLTLLASALLGLGAVHLRRRLRKSNDALAPLVTSLARHPVL